MIVFASDDFNRTSGETIETGEPLWVPIGASAITVSSAGRCYPTAAASNLYYFNAAPGTAEYDVQADLVPITSHGRFAGVFGRLNSAGTNGYHARLNSATLELYRLSGGSFTLLDSASGYDSTTTYTIRLEIRDAAKKVYVDDVEILTSADNLITDAGFAGLRFSGGVATDTTLQHIDNFEVYTPGATSSVGLIGRGLVGNNPLISIGRGGLIS